MKNERWGKKRGRMLDMLERFCLEAKNEKRKAPAKNRK